MLVANPITIFLHHNRAQFRVDKSAFVLNYRASDISRKKKQNFAGFSGANSRKNRPISRDFRGKKVKIRSKIGRFRGIFAGESQNSQKNRPISQDFSGKKSNFEGFLGQILRNFWGKFISGGFRGISCLFGNFAGFRGNT